MSQPRHVDELLAHHQGDEDFCKSFTDCWAAVDVLGTCLLPKEWEVPEALADAISLTKAGINEFTWLKTQAKWSFSDASAMAAVLVTFGRESAFIDVKATRTQEIIDVVSDELSKGTVRLANPMGRESDDAFASQIGEWRDALSAEETEKFLGATHQGLAQLGGIVFGPLGALRSQSNRLLPATRVGATFLCTDPGCSVLHPVQLMTARTESSEALGVLRDHLSAKGRRPSQWSILFSRLIFPDSIREFERFRGMLPSLIGNELDDTERTSLLHYLLSNGDQARSAFRENEATAMFASGHPDEIVTRVAPDALTQLLLLIDDDSLCRGVDQLVADRVIAVPPTEVRTYRVLRTHASDGASDVVPELSTLGVRFRPRRRNAINQLRGFIRQLYEGSGQGELQWFVRTFTGATVEERLNRYIASTEPGEVLRRLVLASPIRLEIAVGMLGIPMISAEHDWSPEEEDRLLRRMLWKLGFDSPEYPDFLLRFHDRRRRFSDSTMGLEGPVPSEQEDAVRGLGSNFFVSLEEVLDAALVLSTWSLLHDHLESRRDRFVFNLRSARAFAFPRLNSAIREAGSGVPLDESGENTIEPLCAAFARLVDVLAEVSSDPERYQRPASMIPSWVGAPTSTQIFPFRHSIPWLDLTLSCRDEIVSVLRSVPRTLTGVGAAEKRNQVVHHKNGFPSFEQIREVCRTVGVLVAELESAGLVPNVYLAERTEIDRHGRGSYAMVDYHGREYRLMRPPEIAFLGLPPPTIPQPIITSSIISGTSEPLRFAIKEGSTYFEMWRDWPPEVVRSVDAASQREAVTIVTDAGDAPAA